MSGSFAKAATEQMLPVLRADLRTELRTAGLVNEPAPRWPEPHDDDAEQEILAAVLSGDVLPADLAPLRGQHFRAHIKQQAFAAADALAVFGAPVTVEAIVELLTHEGYSREAVRSELELARDATPFLCRSTLQQRGERVIELWRQRQLIGVMSEVDAQLRVGVLTHEGAKLRLREYFTGGTK
ncbi:MAG TPA: hypothetical protein VK524_25590 [Polyangiaceae bacterium]|nr:hypothetical protein [Polyangiaceae bacterium]